MTGVRRVATAAVAALLLGACGDDGTTAATHSPEQLGAVLLTASDLGTGWTEEEREVVTTTVPASTPTAENLGLCPDADPSLVPPAPQAHVVLGAPTATERMPVVVIEDLSSAGDAAARLAGLRAAVATCLGKTWTVEGEALTIEPLADPPQAGDEIVSFAGIAGEAPSGALEWYTPTAVVRVGDDLVRVTYLEIHDASTPRAVTSDVFDAVVRKAVDKVATLDS